MVINNRTVENLHHFLCLACRKWWTIGDAPEEKLVWYCPWCGEKNTYDRADKN